MVSPNAPEVGQAVRVRGRLATVRAVEPYDARGAQGRLNLVEIEYLDDCRHPSAEQLLWEAEATASVLGITSLPNVDENRPDSPKGLRAFVNAHRWTRLNRLRDSLLIDDEPLLGVWNSAVQVHPCQLEPVLRALEMPRVSLLLADGVGLGKTIQAGLVLEELLLRRRIRRVLVLCPAMLQRQWRLELRRKFNLEFEIIDSDSTFQLRRRLGIDTNPWRAFPRVITSMDYLRMPDVLQQFLKGSGVDEIKADGRVSPRAVWDLLIVDEAHHLAPQGGSHASQRTRMLREIRFLFEHRIFASATPHNGKTVCFSGLLELLDPVRFQMTAEMTPADRERLAEVRIRRLKDDINRHSLRPPFAEQLDPIELPFRATADEANLFTAVRNYRKKGQQAFAAASAKERWLNQFIFSLLTKRLLSCPYAFARTWWRHIDDDSADDGTNLFDMARVSAERADQETKGDDERAALEDDTARYGGAWLRTRTDDLEALQEHVSKALDALGYSRKVAEADDQIASLARQSDSKTDALVTWVKESLFDQQGNLRDDERLIVFTEYKETLLYLEHRFRLEGFDENTMRLLYGGMTGDQFETIKGEFEDPVAPVRLLIATDAASEGINMQECCRWVTHYDIPWSPSKLQQRNGRVSRHGQVRDVSTYYFRCDQEEDIEFLLKVARKVEQVREDLGSVERVLDSAIHRHFQGQTTSEAQLTQLIEQETRRSTENADLGRNADAQIAQLTRRAKEMLENTDEHLAISPAALIGILKAAIAVEGHGSLDEIPGNPGLYRLKPPPRWEALVRQTLVVGSRNDRMELVFDAAVVEKEINNRRVLRLKKHQILMRLGHPVMRQAMATLCRQLHDPTAYDPIFRWSIAALHKSSFDALLVFHFTVTAINQLREPLHDEVVSVVFRVEGDRLTRVDANFENEVLRATLLPVRSAQRRDEWVRTLRSRWFRHKTALETFRNEQEQALHGVMKKRAAGAFERERTAAEESYRNRLQELQDRTREKEMKKLAEALLREQEEAAQSFLFTELQQQREFHVQELEDQMVVLRRDVEQTREQLIRERDHRLKELLPRRFELRDVRVLPLAVEYIIPATAEDLQS